MCTIRLRVYEIEHEGDIDGAVAEIVRCGGCVSEVSPIDEEESALFIVEAEDRFKFAENIETSNLSL